MNMQDEALDKGAAYQKALEFLQVDELVYMDMIFPLKRGTAELLYARDDGVMLRELESEAYMIAASSLRKGRELADLAGRQKYFCVHQKALAQYLLAMHLNMDCTGFYAVMYDKAEPLSGGRAGALEIKPLSAADIDVVFAHYHAFVDYPYVLQRLESGAMFGGFLAGELCGFIGTHAEGSIGLLEVFEGYRRRGFGEELLAFMTDLFIEQGLVPFGQIAVGNEASMALNKKLGYSFSSEKVFWVY